MAVDDAERPQVVAVGGRQRHPGVELQSDLAGHERVGQGPRVPGGVRHQPRTILEDRRGAQARVPVDLVGFEPVVGLEPDPVGVDDADDGDRHVEQARRQRCDPLERPVGRTVEHVVPANGGQACCLGLRNDVGAHGLGAPQLEGGGWGEGYGDHGVKPGRSG